MGHVFKAGLQHDVPGQMRVVKSEHVCLAGSQHCCVLGDAIGVDASHVGNPVGHVLNRVLQQLVPGQMRVKSEHVCLAGSQHDVDPGAGVVVPQMGTPTGHFVRALLQQNTEESNGHTSMPGGHDMNRGSQHPREAQRGIPVEQGPS